MEKKKYRKIRPELLNVSGSITSKNQDYGNEEVLQTQSKLLDTKGDVIGPSFIDLNSKKENKNLKLKVSKHLNEEVDKLSSNKKRVKTIRVESSVNDQMQHSNIPIQLNEGVSDDDFEFSSHKSEQNEKVKVKKTKSEVIKIKKEDTRARKIKEANEDRKAQILAEIMKYEKIDENTLKMKKEKRPWYTIDPLSWFHFLHCFTILTNIFIIIIWI